MRLEIFAADFDLFERSTTTKARLQVGDRIRVGEGIGRVVAHEWFFFGDNKIGQRVWVRWASKKVVDDRVRKGAGDDEK